jgi:hypothetical protein
MTARLAHALVAAAVLLVAAPAPRALASHYPLDQVRALIPRDDARKLRRAGVRTTADFLVWGRTAEGRSLLAGRAHLPVEQVTSWVLLADLLQVRGIGPDVARLLTAVGVRSLADLQHADADATAAAILELNKRTRMSPNPPGAASIRYWVDLARSLPVVVSLE